jgi:hypothetical protein
MPWVGFDPTIPDSERAKIENALDRSATVTGPSFSIGLKYGGISVIRALLTELSVIRDRWLPLITKRNRSKMRHVCTVF